MTERVAEPSASVAVELVCERVDDLAPGVNGMVPKLVDVGDVNAMIAVTLPLTDPGATPSPSPSSVT